MREILNVILAIIIAVALVVGILSAIALGISTLTGFPFWVGLLIAIFILITWVVTVDEDAL